MVCGIKDEGGHLRHGPARVCNVLAVEQKLRGLVPRARLRANPRDRPAERVAPDLIAVALLIAEALGGRLAQRALDRPARALHEHLQRGAET